MSKIDEFIEKYRYTCFGSYDLVIKVSKLEQLRPYVELGELYIKILDYTRPIQDNMKLANHARGLIELIKHGESNATK
jgi:hypothetical protein